MFDYFFIFFWISSLPANIRTFYPLYSFFFTFICTRTSLARPPFLALVVQLGTGGFSLGISHYLVSPAGGRGGPSTQCGFWHNPRAPWARVSLVKGLANSLPAGPLRAGEQAGCLNRSPPVHLGDSWKIWRRLQFWQAFGSSAAWGHSFFLGRPASGRVF